MGDPAHDWLVHSAVRAATKTLRTSNARFVCDDYLLIRNLAREGAGVGMLPRFVAAQFLREGLLEPVTLADQPTLRGGMFLVYPSRGQVPRKVTAFRDFLIDWLKKSPFA
jgi:DNA-binding transcriptional LysR family regulator